MRRRVFAICLFLCVVLFTSSVVIAPGCPFVVREMTLSAIHRVVRHVPARVIPKPIRLTDERTCLAIALLKEAGGEPSEGIAAVAAVIFNRMADAKYPHSICGVVFQKAQFSFTTTLYRLPSKARLQAMRTLASQFVVHKRDIMTRFGDITHFHHVSVNPKWSQDESLRRAYVIGNHVFYYDYTAVESDDTI